jgi:hypothetical protein
MKSRNEESGPSLQNTLTSLAFSSFWHPHKPTAGCPCRVLSVTVLGFYHFWKDSKGKSQGKFQCYVL